MSISIFLPDLRAGGTERVNLDLAYEFGRMGYRPEFVLMQARGELLEEARSAFPIIELECTRIRQTPIALARYLRRRRPDGLIAAMWPLTAAAPVVCQTASRRTRVLVSEHGILSAQYRDRGVTHGLLLRATAAIGYRLADARVGVSNGVADDMARLSRMERRKFNVISNPVPPPSAPNAEALALADALWGAARGARILSVGRLKRVKNHALLMRAFAQLKRADARLMLVGNGELEEDLLGLASRLGIADRTVFAGFQSDPTPFYRTADLFVLSSDHEGFGNVIVEAMACGIPVVSTDCPSGPSEILAGGKYGTLVPAGDTDTLAHAIAEALTSRDDPDRLRVWASTFVPETAARAYLELLLPA
jgi:glycosyltransferase involved in cell wall biosynthesis